MKTVSLQQIARINTLQQIDAIRAILDKAENIILSDPNLYEDGNGELYYSEARRREVFACKIELAKILHLS